MPLIVLEGLDGAGKSTQLDLVRRHVEAQGRECEYLHFPRFDTPVYGELIARFLRGELGGIDAVDPYIVALLFAGDRADAAKTIRGWLSHGKYVLLDRYVGSNVAYQCAKLGVEDERERLREWIMSLEYVHNEIPRPDVSLFLDVPFEFTERSLRTHRCGNDRDYLNGGEDIHESSLAFQHSVREMYMRMAAVGDVTIVDCRDADDGMCAPHEVFSRILTQANGIL